MPPLTLKMLYNQPSQQPSTLFLLQPPVSPVQAQPPVPPLLSPLQSPQPPQHLQLWRNSALYCLKRQLRQCSGQLFGIQPNCRRHPRSGTCRKFRGSMAISQQHRHSPTHAARSISSRNSRAPPRALATKLDKQPKVYTITKLNIKHNKGNKYLLLYL